MAEIIIEYWEHALKRKYQKGISDSEVKRAIQRGAKKSRKNGSVVTKFADLEIVYRKLGEIHYIITIVD